MRFNSLQFGKAMSAALFVLLQVVVGLKNALAQTQAATLQHEGNIIVYYGENALINANAAAAIGDTITLSSGSFKGCTLSKPVMIHGAGCVEDTEASILPTTISSNISLDNHNDTIPLTIEGVDGSSICFYYKYGCKNVVINKCNIDRVYPNDTYNTTSYIYDSHWENCVIKEFKYRGSGATIINSVLRIYGLYEQTNSENINTIYNSIIVLGVCDLNNSMVINSIISSSYGSHDVTNSTFYNCIGIRLSGSSLFNGQINSTNIEVSNYIDVFETFAGTVIFDNNYQLKEEIANSFLGNDGTEVGIYGGMMPYHTRPSYMIIRRCNVAGRTTDDNKLSVEIELITSD